MNDQALVNITPLKVFDYVPGQKITVPGVYKNVPMDFYHGDCCDAPSISSSGVRLIESRSLKHYFDTSYLNPNRAEPDDSTHFSLGRAIHHLAGGEADFRKYFTVRPAKWESWRSNDAKAWRAEQKLAHLDVLVPDDIEVIKGVADELNDHPTVQAGILKGLVEHSIFWPRYIRVSDGRVIKIWCKARPDVIPVDGRIVTDLKTTTDASRGKVIKSIGEFHYHVQLGMIDEGLRRVWDWRAEQFVLAFVEKKRPFAINLKPVDPIAIEYGRRQLKRALPMFAEAIATGYWEGYRDDEEQVGLPDWMAMKLAREAEKGLLPPLDNEPDPAPDPEPATLMLEHSDPI